MKNFICSGNVLTVIAAAAILSGDLVLVGTVVGVATNSAAIDEQTEVAVTGVFEVPKAAGALAQGALVYYDATAKKLTATASGNTLAGYAYQAAANGDATVYVKLNG